MPGICLASSTICCLMSSANSCCLRQPKASAEHSASASHSSRALPSIVTLAAAEPTSQSTSRIPCSLTPTWCMKAEAPFSQLKMAGFGCMPSDLHRRCMLQLSVMQDIFSSRNREWRLGIYYGVLKPECPLAVYNKMLPKTSFWFQLKSFSCLEDLLASLLSDGYDLATLQPFLAG